MTAFQKESFTPIFAEEFSDVFNNKDQKILQREINKVKMEAEKQIRENEEVCRDELNQMNSELMDKIHTIQMMKAEEEKKMDVVRCETEQIYDQKI